VSNKPGHRGEREVSRKTIARGMPGETGVTVVTMLVCLFYFACEAAGASSARHSLRPLISESGTFWQTSRETCGEIAELCFEPGDTKTLVMPGLDPGIHLLRKSFLEADGLPGQTRQ